MTLTINDQFLEAHIIFPNTTTLNRIQLCGVLAGNISPRSQKVLKARNFWTVEKLDMNFETEVENVSGLLCINAFWAEDVNILWLNQFCSSSLVSFSSLD